MISKVVITNTLGSVFLFIEFNTGRDTHLISINKHKQTVLLSDNLGKLQNCGKFLRYNVLGISTAGY